MRIDSHTIETLAARTVVVGSGTAGLNAADWLYDLGERDVLLMTEGLGMGTSRNTGSDKQTYYKLSFSGDDSVEALAKTLHVDGVHGDLALSEAAGSVQSFFKLANLGVAFPTNEYGEFAGYRTDHDPLQRGTSAGPLTSRDMTECLLRQVRGKGIRIASPLVAFELLTTPDKRLCGVLAYDARKKGYVAVRCAHVVLATGGPAHLYARSVYPACHTGMSGMALALGAEAANLQHWQYGLASLKFRWNVSGSYQQVLPRYISIDEAGVEREFLYEAFASAQDALHATFLKGYQWPFDVAKIRGSSRVDFLVYRETQLLGRRVYLDFTRNPSALDARMSGLDAEAYGYLEQSGALQATPIERLEAMNPQAVALYAGHGIDLAKEPLEIDVCAQHHNGGLAVDHHWRTSVPGLYAIGEAAGTFGAYRPGGSALNSGQVGSLRAAQHIVYESEAQMLSTEAFYEATGAAIARSVRAVEAATVSEEELLERRNAARSRMSRDAAFYRDPAAMAEHLAVLPGEIDGAFHGEGGRPVSKTALLKYRDQLVTMQAVLSAMLASAEARGSVGSGLVRAAEGCPVLENLPGHGYAADSAPGESKVCRTRRGPEGGFDSDFIPARGIPERDSWFESVWRGYRARMGRGQGSK